MLLQLPVPIIEQILLQRFQDEIKSAYKIGQADSLLNNINTMSHLLKYLHQLMSIDPLIEKIIKQNWLIKRLFTMLFPLISLQQMMPWHQHAIEQDQNEDAPTLWHQEAYQHMEKACSQNHWYLLQVFESLFLHLQNKYGQMREDEAFDEVMIWQSDHLGHLLKFCGKSRLLLFSSDNSHLQLLIATPSVLKHEKLMKRKQQKRSSKTIVVKSMPAMDKKSLIRQQLLETSSSSANYQPQPPHALKSPPLMQQPLGIYHQVNLFISERPFIPSEFLKYEQQYQQRSPIQTSISPLDRQYWKPPPRFYLFEDLITLAHHLNTCTYLSSPSKEPSDVFQKVSICHNLPLEKCKICFLCFPVLGKLQKSGRICGRCLYVMDLEVGIWDWRKIHY